jgi:GNAT superfamily N-acetyltransferase
MNTTVYEIVTAQTDEEILKCFDLLKMLRPHLSREHFVEQVRHQAKEGYHLIYIEDHEEVKSVAGYRMGHFLAWGKVLYVDDLITSPEARGIGFGTHLLKWLLGEAKKNLATASISTPESAAKRPTASIST